MACRRAAYNEPRLASSMVLASPMTNTPSASTHTPSFGCPMDCSGEDNKKSTTKHTAPTPTYLCSRIIVHFMTILENVFSLMTRSPSRHRRGTRASLLILSVVLPPYLDHNVAYTSMALVAKNLRWGLFDLNCPRARRATVARSADLTRRYGLLSIFLHISFPQHAKTERRLEGEFTQLPDCDSIGDITLERIWDRLSFGILTITPSLR
jgi:hypothetical protein